MNSVNVNSKICDLLLAHGLEITTDDEFVYANLKIPLKFKTNVSYNQFDGYISSQMDVMVLTDEGDTIIESFGDFGIDLETAVNNNFINFISGTFHPILAVFNNDIEKYADHVLIEKWEIDGESWIAYIGNLVPKSDSYVVNPPDEFFNNIVNAIQSQKLNNDIHWFRGYYLQTDDCIYSVEFLMDNINITKKLPEYSKIPLLPNASYYSCRNFIILKRA